MTALPCVSVIMPAFNAARTIRASLASAQRQTLADIEILVVDDGSTDMTAELALAVSHGDPRIRVMRQANAGPMAARNRAIAMARARYLAPLDADDLWHPTYLDELVAVLEPWPAAGFAYALHHVIDGAGRVIATPPLPLVAGWGFRRHLLVNFVGCGSAAVFRRSALLAAGGYDPVWGLGRGGGLSAPAADRGPRPDRLRATQAGRLPPRRGQRLRRSAAHGEGAEGCGGDGDARGGRVVAAAGALGAGRQRP